MAKKTPTRKKATKKVAKKKIAKKKVATRKATKKTAKKKTRNIVIQINNVKGLISHVQANIQKKQQEERNQIIESSNFWDWLKKQNKLSLETFKIDFNDPMYRVYPEQFTVTSIIGSIADGARLNIGGSQLTSYFPFRKYGAVYYATTMICAIAEYTQGTPLGANDIKYTLQPEKTFELWDLDKVIQTLAHPSISLLISKLPIGGGWSNCKVPMPSQILAYWLKNIGGDGIIFTSTKDSTAKAIALFAKDDSDSESLVTVISKTNI